MQHSNSPRAAFAAALFSLLAVPAWGGDVRIPIASGGALVVTVPEGWQQRSEAGPVPTLSLTPAKGSAFHVLVSPLVTTDGRMAPASREALRELVASGAEQARPQAVETSLPLHELASPTVQGTYFSATDRAPKPGEYKYLTQGAAAVQGLPVTFTILSNGNAEAAVRPALQMIRGARRE